MRAPFPIAVVARGLALLSVTLPHLGTATDAGARPATPRSQDAPPTQGPPDDPDPAPLDEETRARWAGRLEAPPIYDIDVTVTWRMDVRLHDLGLPEGAEARRAHAAALRSAGGSEALALMADLAALSEEDEPNPETLGDLTARCLGAFETELERHPDELSLRVGFSRTLRNAAGMSGRTDLLEGSVAEIEAARRIAPDDLAVLRECAMAHLRALDLSLRSGRPELAHLEALASLAREHEDLAPREAAGPWLTYTAAQYRAMLGDPSRTWPGILTAADRLATRAESVDEPLELLLLAESCRATGGILPRLTRDRGALDTWDATPAEEELLGRLRALLGRATEGDADPALVTGARRVGWFLECAAGDPARRAELLPAYLGPGLSLESARSIALAVWTLRGESERAEEVAEELLAAPPGPEGHLALASYFGKTARPERALGHLAASAVAEPRMLLARAVWLVQLGRLPQAEALLETVYRDESLRDRSLVLHTLGVLLATQGDLETAARMLNAAQRLAPGGPWTETLREVEALRAGRR